VLHSDLADALRLDTAMLRTARAPRQALLIFRLQSRHPVADARARHFAGDVDGR
jgi:hypothetical protein